MRAYAKNPAQREAVLMSAKSHVHVSCGARQGVLFVLGITDSGMRILV